MLHPMAVQEVALKLDTEETNLRGSIDVFLWLKVDTPNGLSLRLTWKPSQDPLRVLLHPGFPFMLTPE